MAASWRIGSRPKAGVRRNSSTIAPPAAWAVFVALGDNALRVELLQKLAAAGYDTPVFISDMAAVSPSAVLEPGCVILPQAYVGADAHLGVGCIINGGAIVDHDAVLGRGVHVAPGGIVKAGAEVEALTKVDSWEIIKK